jgi:hypothetical protein
MPPQRKTVIRGISEVGAVRSGADVTFGRTTPDGVSIVFSGNELEVESGQSTFLEQLFSTSDRIAVTVNLLFADLVNLREVLGLPESALTGDLNAGTPTAEVLAILEANMRTRTDVLYVLAPGPTSTRRYLFNRAKLRGGATITHGRDNHTVLTATWEVLRPASGNVVTITDAI